MYENSLRIYEKIINLLSSSFLIAFENRVGCESNFLPIFIVQNDESVKLIGYEK